MRQQAPDDAEAMLAEEGRLCLCVRLRTGVARCRALQERGEGREHTWPPGVRRKVRSTVSLGSKPQQLPKDGWGRFRTVAATTAPAAAVDPASLIDDCLQENASSFELSPCLSRACLGKMISFSTDLL